jgi:hypothetical protein
MLNSESLLNKLESGTQKILQYFKENKDLQ